MLKDIDRIGFDYLNKETAEEHYRVLHLCKKLL